MIVVMTAASKVIAYDLGRFHPSANLELTRFRDGDVEKAKTIRTELRAFLRDHNLVCATDYHKVFGAGGGRPFGAGGHPYDDMPEVRGPEWANSFPSNWHQDSIFARPGQTLWLCVWANVCPTNVQTIAGRSLEVYPEHVVVIRDADCTHRTPAVTKGNRWFARTHLWGEIAPKYWRKVEA